MDIKNKSISINCDRGTLVLSSALVSPFAPRLSSESVHCQDVG